MTEKSDDAAVAKANLVGTKNIDAAVTTRVFLRWRKSDGSRKRWKAQDCLKRLSL